MSNRFHNKWHRKNHHTYGNASNPDASHDPIASPDQPFLGDFSIQGAISCVAPASAYAGYFFSNNTALCALAGDRAMLAKSFGPIGIQVDSKSVAISAYAPNVGVNVYSLQRAISAYGVQRGAYIGSNERGLQVSAGIIGTATNSPNIALSAYGENFGATVYSPSRAISAYGGLLASELYSSNIALSALGHNCAIQSYSTNIATSSFGYNVGGLNYSHDLGTGTWANLIGLSSYGGVNAIYATSPNVAILAESKNIAIAAKSTEKTAISAYGREIGIDTSGDYIGIKSFSSGVGVSAYGGKTGIIAISPTIAISAYSPEKALHIAGYSLFDGSVTITGNLSTLGALTYLDTYVHITSALRVENIGTGPGVWVTQKGTENIAEFYDGDEDHVALLIEDGGNVGIGLNNPEANLHVVDINNNSHPEVRIQSRNNLFNPTLRLMGNVSTEGFSIWSDNVIGDTYLKNLTPNPQFNRGISFETAGNSDALTILNDGKVGVNTKLPTTSLTVNGNISSNGDIFLNTFKKIKFGNEDLTKPDAGSISFEYIDGGNGKLYIDTSNVANEPIVLRQTSNATTYNRLAVTENGFVAVGSEMPSNFQNIPAHLSVYGNISSFKAFVAEDLYFGTGQWPDVRLYRSAPDVLKTDDKFEFGGGIDVTGIANINTSPSPWGTYIGNTDANAGNVYIGGNTYINDSGSKSTYINRSPNTGSVAIGNNTGNVELDGNQINISSPNLTLESNDLRINGNATFNNNLTVNTLSGAYIFLTTPTPWSVNPGPFDSNDNPKLFIGSSSARALSGVVLSYDKNKRHLKFTSEVRKPVSEGGAVTTNESFIITPEGYVGIGFEPYEKLAVDGNIIASGNITSYSDEKLKTNIHTIEKPLEMVSKLRGVKYDRIDNKQTNIGLIAQEVEKILPEVVFGDDTKSVSYGNIVAVLIEAIKELNKKVEYLESKINMS